MSRVEVQRIPESSDRSLPVFDEFEKIADQIRMQAYNLFAHRGSNDGQALDDWLAAEREFCWPAAELAESDGQFTLKVALAGFDAKEIAVTATPREIIIKAAHRHERSSREAELKWSEFRSNRVLRRVELPGDVDVDRISASFKDGLLEITAPKAKGQAAEPGGEIELSAPSGGDEGGR
jgi:HSP20 family protein